MSLLYNSSFRWTALKWMALSKEPAFPSLARAPSSVELLDFYVSRDKCNERIFLYNSVPTSFWNATSLIGKAYSSCDRLLIEHSAQWTCELKEIHFISGCHLQMYLLTAALLIADCCGCGSHYVINKWTRIRCKWIKDSLLQIRIRQIAIRNSLVARGESPRGTGGSKKEQRKNPV